MVSYLLIQKPTTVEKHFTCVYIRCDNKHLQQFFITMSNRATSIVRYIACAGLSRWAACVSVPLP